jgi:hypothetical protein
MSVAAEVTESPEEMTPSVASRVIKERDSETGCWAGEYRTRPAWERDSKGGPLG